MADQPDIKKDPKPEETAAVKMAQQEPLPKEEASAKPDAPRKERRERTAEDVFLELEGAEEAEKPKILKAKGSKNIHSGVVHICATFNNTIVSVSDMNGNVIGWSSAGKMGFRGSRKSTAYAAQLVSQDACRQAMSHGLREAEVRVKGPGAGANQRFGRCRRWESILTESRTSRRCRIMVAGPKRPAGCDL